MRKFACVDLFCGAGGLTHGFVLENLPVVAGINLDPACRFPYDQSDNNPRIETMRELHRKIDIAVARAYGWDALDLEHDFHEVPYLPENDRVRFTISDRARLEVLRRLFELNRQRYEEEVAQGIHGNARPTTLRRSPRATAQPTLDFGAFPTAPASDTHPAVAILAFLQTHDGWRAKADILNTTGIAPDQWNTAITALVDSGKGERRGARCRAANSIGGADGT